MNKYLVRFIGIIGILVNPDLREDNTNDNEDNASDSEIQPNNGGKVIPSDNVTNDTPNE